MASNKPATKRKDKKSRGKDVKPPLAVSIPVNWGTGDLFHLSASSEIDETSFECSQYDARVVRANIFHQSCFTIRQVESYPLKINVDGLVMLNIPCFPCVSLDTAAYGKVFDDVRVVGTTVNYYPSAPDVWCGTDMLGVSVHSTGPAPFDSMDKLLASGTSKQVSCAKSLELYVGMGKIDGQFQPIASVVPKCWVCVFFEPCPPPPPTDPSKTKASFWAGTIIGRVQLEHLVQFRRRQAGRRYH